MKFGKCRDWAVTYKLHEGDKSWAKEPIEGMGAPGEFLRLSEIIGNTKLMTRPLIPVSKGTVWAWVRKGLFPKPYTLGPRVTAWKADEVYAWMRSREQFTEAMVSAAIEASEARDG